MAKRPTKEQKAEDKAVEDWMTKKWRPMMAMMYMSVCAFDFILAPILWAVVQFWETQAANDAFRQWQPLTLQGAGLFHMAMGAIIGVAHALGETAPLLLIGMSAFVASVPTTPFDQATALPVQVYLWQGNELRNFFEGRTAAAIIVLLALMIGLNSLAIWLRKKFEVRW